MMQLLDTVNAALWGAPGVGLLTAAGVWLTVRTGFFQLTRLPLWLGQTLGAILRRSPDLAQEETGSISPLESLCTALGATIGTGSVVGVGAALASDDDRLRRKPAGPAIPALLGRQLARRPDVLPCGRAGGKAP